MKYLAMGLTVLLALSFNLVSQAADFTGDGTNDIGIFRPSTGLWAIRGVTRAYFGGSNDDPMPGDYNGDGIVDIGIFRPSSGLWAVQGVTRTYFGGPGDEPIAGNSTGGCTLVHDFGTKNIFVGEMAGNPTIAGPCNTAVGYGALFSSSTDSLENTAIGALALFNNKESYQNSTVGYASLLLNSIGDNNSALGAWAGTMNRTGNGNVFLGYRAGYFETGSNKLYIANDFTSSTDPPLIYGDFDTGFVGIGTTNPDAPLVVKGNNPGFAAVFKNDGNLNGYKGLRVQCGTDDNSGTNYMIAWHQGDGAYIGSIRSTGGNITYGTFTGEHEASIPENDNPTGYQYGTVVRLRSKRANPERPRQDNYDVEPSTEPYDKAVFGIYAGKLPEQENLHSIYAIGDGHILVTKEGGDIEGGDYLTTSSRMGHAMKQDNLIRYSYTVAKALESVNWDKEKDDSKLIGCTYQTQ